jgi:hypothetical protein
MGETDHERDAERMDAVHAAVNDGKLVAPVVASWGMDEAKRIIDLVMDEYIKDFNQALWAGTPALDVRAFTQKYDALWLAKLDLDVAKNAR